MLILIVNHFHVIYAQMDILKLIINCKNIIFWMIFKLIIWQHIGNMLHIQHVNTLVLCFRHVYYMMDYLLLIRCI